MEFEPIEIEGDIIAGPCSAESREQVVNTALALSRQGIKTYRAGLWKPRTKPGGFEGVGSIGIPWLLEAKKLTGMRVATEVATRAHVLECIAAGIDIFWIGARTSANPFAVQEIADTIAETGQDVTVMVKNPVNPDIDLWIGGIERLYNAGIHRLAAIHRGFSSYGEKIYRNPPQWSIPTELRQRLPGLPIICDPSHIGGSRDLIAPLSQQAYNLGFNKLIIECHCHPEEALSDSRQQITPEELGRIIQNLKQRSSEDAGDEIGMLRNEMDIKDAELIDILSQRMAISRQIGEYKKSHNITVFQNDRYKQLMDSRVKTGHEMGMSADFVKKLYSLIHEESVRQQLEI